MEQRNAALAQRAGGGRNTEESTHRWTRRPEGYLKRDPKYWPTHMTQPAPATTATKTVKSGKATAPEGKTLSEAAALPLPDAMTLAVDVPVKDGNAVVLAACCFAAELFDPESPVAYEAATAC